MFRIKICGVRSIEDAQNAADAGADAIGLNFYEQSVRYVSERHAHSIVNDAPKSLASVGVFVNHSLNFIERTADRIGLDYIQLHGDEPLAMVDDLGGERVIRALRLAGDMNLSINKFISDVGTLGRPPAAVLVEPRVDGRYGGTGSVVDWEAVELAPFEQSEMKTILAGGLRPENVAAAIAEVRPWGVDTASGVESQPGVKDAGLMCSFVRAARQALDE